MKAILFLILIALHSQNDWEICSGQPAEDDDYCHNLALPSDAFRCCYREIEYDNKGTSIEAKDCQPLTKDQYDDIPGYISEGEEELRKKGYTDIKLSVDCNSNYVKISLLSLILLFL